MTSTQDPTQEFEVLAKLAGLTIPEDRLATIAQLSAEVREMATLLRSMDITPADEPANIYCFDPILRSE